MIIQKCSSDPDAPSRVDHFYREWLHWLVVNVPGDAQYINTTKGTTIEEYAPASPPKGSGRAGLDF